MRTIPKEHLGKLVGMYMHASFLHKKDGAEISARKQKKMRKWMVRHYKERIDAFPEEIRSHFAPEKSDAEVFDFLEGCLELQQALAAERMQRNESVADEFDREVKEALLSMLDDDDYIGVSTVGNDLEIRSDFNHAYCERLILEDVEGDSARAFSDKFIDGDTDLTKAGDRYCLTFHAAQAETGEEETIEVTFRDAHTRVEFYNCVKGNGYQNDPWQILLSAASSLKRKEERFLQFCNEKERELLPLISELTALGYWFPESENIHFSNLKTLCERHGQKEIAASLEKLERICREGKYNQGGNGLIRNINAALCDKSAEPVWREIYERIKESQLEYPKAVDLRCPADLQDRVRAEIQRLMEGHGYTGTYPDFVKTGPMRGIHLEESYGMTYFVGREKRVQSCIHCDEYFDEFAETWAVQFMCGTAFLKSGEAEDDIFGCMFNAKGRRIFNSLDYHVQSASADEEEMPDLTALSLYVRVAVKRAELRKLNKEERKLEFKVNCWRLFWISFLLFGGLFSILWTPAMMLFAVLDAAISGRSGEILGLITEPFWLIAFGLAWLGAGGVMGLVTVLAGKK